MQDARVISPSSRISRVLSKSLACSSEKHKKQSGNTKGGERGGKERSPKVSIRDFHVSRIMRGNSVGASTDDRKEEYRQNNPKFAMGGGGGGEKCTQGENGHTGGSPDEESYRREWEKYVRRPTEEKSKERASAKQTNNDSPTVGVDRKWREAATVTARAAPLGAERRRAFAMRAI